MELLSGMVSPTRRAYSGIRQVVVKASVAAPATVARGWRVAKDYASSTIYFVAPTPYEYEEQMWEKAEHEEDGYSIDWVPSPLGNDYIQRQLNLPPVPSG